MEIKVGDIVLYRGQYLVEILEFNRLGDDALVEYLTDPGNRDICWETGKLTNYIPKHSGKFWWACVDFISPVLLETYQIF